MQAANPARCVLPLFIGQDRIKFFFAGSKEDAAAIMSSMQKNMAYIFPVMTVFIAMRLPSALALYWFVSTIFGALQAWYIKRTHGNTGVPVV